MRAALAFVVLAACGSPTPAATTVTVQPLPSPPVVVATAEVTRAPAGKVGIVHFFASWCAPCALEMPALQAISDRHAGEVEVTAIGEDDDEPEMRSFVARMKVTYKVVWDNSKSKASKWKVQAMPSTFVIDKTGATRFTHAGYRDDDKAALETEVTALLGEH
jgi:thiol-disulfide isomerase/thioredoxin